MSRPPRSGGRRDRRGGDPDERLRRILESQQAASEASRAILAVAAARRDAEWREAAEGNRRRVLVALGSPLLLGVLLMAMGALVSALLIAGAAVAILWLVVAARIWRRPTAGVLRGVGGVSAPTAAAQGTISTAEAERLADVTEGLCAALGLPVPAIEIVEGDVPNAVALGRGPEDAMLIVTAGTARSLDRIELEAVLAHELAHVKALDILTAGVAASGLGTVGDALSGGRFGAWLHGPDREIRADLAGVSTTRYPPGLITALERIATGAGVDASGRTGVPPREQVMAEPRACRRLEMSWLAPPPNGAGRPVRRGQSELDVRLDVLREL